MSTINTIEFVDMHTHILPEVDDGSTSMEETLQMLEMEYEEGVRTIIATPHYIPGSRNASVERLQDTYTKVCEKAAEILPELKIYLGNEIYYRDGVVRDLREQKALTLAGTDYVLVEFSVRSDNNTIFNAVKKMTEAGFRPVIAHMERYECLYRKTALVEDLIDAGAYIQINTESLPGGMFDARSAYCRSLLGDGLVHFLGSDCHDTIRRKPLMKTALSKLKKEEYKKQIDRIMDRHIHCLLENKWI